MALSRRICYSVCLLMPARVVLAGAYNVALNMQGSAFFSAFDFYGFYDNLTWGNVNYLSESSAMSNGLTYILPNGNAVIKVDNVTDVYNSTRVIDNAMQSNRDSVRLTSKLFYPIGSLFIIDALHIPYGCSVWPALWTTTQDIWPVGGEIDIIEAINLMTHNNMAVHTTPGCNLITNQTPPGQLSNCSSPSGCVTWETKSNSFGSGFAENGGGVYAMQFDTVGIFIWFWPRHSVPLSINQSTSTSSIDLTDWGAPSASHLSSDACDIPVKFDAQQIIINIALCGVWAGVPSIYNQTCGMTQTANCVVDNVWGPPSGLNNAYFEFNYIRTYTLSGVTPFLNTTSGLEPVNSTNNSSGTGNNSGSPPSGLPSSAAPSHRTFLLRLYVLTLMSYVVFLA